MSRKAIIPPQPDDGRPPMERLGDFAKRIMSVPKSAIDKAEQGEKAARQKRRKTK